MYNHVLRLGYQKICSISRVQCHRPKTYGQNFMGFGYFSTKKEHGLYRDVADTELFSLVSEIRI